MRTTTIIPALLAGSISPSHALTLRLPRSLLPRWPLSTLEISKPPITPAFSESSQDAHLQTDLSPVAYTTTPWPANWLPKSCLEEASNNGLHPSDIEVTDVFYTDCAAPWTICRHRATPLTWAQILTTLSQVPVGMRQHVSNLLVLPSKSPLLKTAAAYTRGSVLVFTPTFFKLGVLFHEFTHIMDTAAPALQDAVRSQAGKYPPGTPFSRTELWAAAVGKDSALPTPYAGTTWQEDFADAGRWAMSDMTHAGGLGVYSAGWTACRNQIGAYEAWMGGIIFTRDGMCTGKVPSSRAVEVPVSRGAMAGGEMGRRPPKATLEGVDVMEIVLPAGAEDMLYVYQGPMPGMEY
ncbi:hypothetical protein B0T17DRAFT_590320 [Bombardia bombarda]|uniref:Uncharacterized protein n=1 Tax=Bombardia bombarda TaxID=252184 RepID=A0AA40CAE1_9PEZI|nr:hypothetical protein B0T17DRAFT_590320 [Bombardia bombarda]